jgi:hypothetical protein
MCVKCRWKNFRVELNYGGEPCPRCGGRVTFSSEVIRELTRPIGRPILKPGQKTAKIWIGIPKDELKLLDKLATKQKKLRSTFIRDCVRVELKKAGMV